MSDVPTVCPECQDWPCRCPKGASDLQEATLKRLLEYHEVAVRDSIARQVEVMSHYLEARAGTKTARYLALAWLVATPKMIREGRLEKP